MHTTINVCTDVMYQIEQAAQSKGITRSKMIITLLKIVLAKECDKAHLGSMIKYQDTRSPDEWHTFHIQYRDDEYEYFLDMKKLLKMSLSLILAHAVYKYLKSGKRKIKTDNYTFYNYVIIREFNNNLISWRYIWGYPNNIETHL